MKVEFGTGLKDLDGVDMTEPKTKPGSQGETLLGEDGKPVMEKVTLLKVCKIVLMASFEDERALGGDKKFDRWTLAQKINGGNTEVTAEEVTLLKSLIAKGFGPRVVGPAYVVLEAGEKQSKAD